MAWDVVSLYNDTVVVHLLNPCPECVSLHKNMKIAELTELRIISIVSRKFWRLRRQQYVRKEETDIWAMVNCASELTLVEQEEFFELVLSYADTLAEAAHDLGHTDKLKHTICTGETQSIHQVVRCIPLCRKIEVTKLVLEMLDNDAINCTSSPWEAPIFLVQKKHGSHRFCVDYRKFNSVTRNCAYPLPRIDNTLECYMAQSSLAHY